MCAFEATYWTRLSCHRFRADEVRLLLAVIAYNLSNLLGRVVLPVAIQSWSLTSLQRLFKTPVRVLEDLCLRLDGHVRAACRGPEFLGHPSPAYLNGCGRSLAAQACQLPG